MRVGNSKYEAMIICWKMVDSLLRVRRDGLLQAKELKYLGVFFKSESNMECEIYRQFGMASTVMQAFLWTIMVKKKLSGKAMFSIYRSIYIPTVTYGHEVWEVTKRMSL